MQPSYDPTIVALSILVAAFASYVALDLARRVRTPDRSAARLWCSGGALVMGSGIWSMHFVGMLGFSLPVQIGYDPFKTLLSWVAAVAASYLALTIAGREQLTPRVLAAGALTMGGGIGAMHYTGMAALEMAPGIVWDWTLVAASMLVACGASAAALLIFFGLRRLDGLKAQAAQAGAALVMGAAISGMHYTAMLASGFPEGAVCLSADGLGGTGLVATVTVSAAVLLSITLFVSSMMDIRLQARANQLAKSLQEANERLQQVNAELHRRAFEDPLTGVANRALFENRLAHASARLARAADRGDARRQDLMAVLLIDLDGFKPVNDAYGHASGDLVLQQVAKRLHAVTREADTLARLGGDEFVIVLDAITHPADAAGAAERVLEALRAPMRLDQRELTLSCSIGVAVSPHHGHGEALVSCADIAMYSAKGAGGGRYVLYDPSMQDAAREQVELQLAMRDALKKGELHMHYQPKIDARRGVVRSVEALLRWTHPTRGAVSPATFIPIAERYGVILALGEWVIEEVCRQIEHWSAAGFRMRVSINLSRHQLREPDVVLQLRRAMQRHGVAADQIVCEITESAAMEDSAATSGVLEELRALGVELSIDDFGTGFSSLAALRQLRTHEIKIDRAFVHDVDTSSDALAVVDAVVRLGRALGLRVVAEGVETREQRRVLIDLGCDELQGFYFARPLAPDELVRRGALVSDDDEQIGFSPSVLLESREPVAG